MIIFHKPKTPFMTGCLGNFDLESVATENSSRHMSCLFRPVPEQTNGVPGSEELTSPFQVSTAPRWSDTPGGRWGGLLIYTDIPLHLA